MLWTKKSFRSTNRSNRLKTFAEIRISIPTGLGVTSRKATRSLVNIVTFVKVWVGFESKKKNKNEFLSFVHWEIRLTTSSTETDVEFDEKNPEFFDSIRNDVQRYIEYLRKEIQEIYKKVANKVNDVRWKISQKFNFWKDEKFSNSFNLWNIFVARNKFNKSNEVNKKLIFCWKARWKTKRKTENFNVEKREQCLHKVVPGQREKYLYLCFPVGGQKERDDTKLVLKTRKSKSTLNERMIFSSDDSLFFGDLKEKNESKINIFIFADKN